MQLKKVTKKTVSLLEQRTVKTELKPITELSEIQKLWEETFTLENLRHIYLTRVTSDRIGNPKKSIGIDYVTTKNFEKNIDENINIILRKVKNGTYKFTRYKLLLINKGPGKPPREITIPTIRDRVTQIAMSDFARAVLGAKCEIPKGKNIIREIIKERGNYTGFSKSDISQFFKSIDHALLQDILNSKFKDSSITDLFMKAVSTNSFSQEYKVPQNNGKRLIGIPEGLSFSAFLANIVLESIDDKYQAIKDIKYYRYVDDILILCSKETSEKYSNMIQEDFKNLKLKINTEKIANANEDLSFDYLGYVFDGDKITIREKTVSKIVNRLVDTIRQEARMRKNNKSENQDLLSEIKKFFENNFKENCTFNKPLIEKLNNFITGFIINGVHYSWINYYSLINDYTLMGKLDAIVKKLLDKYEITDIKPKKHLKALLECQHNNNSSYIPDFTSIKILTIKDKDENIDIEVNKRLMQQIAKHGGWNKSSDLQEDFKEALSLAISEGFTFDKKEDKYFINMKKFKVCIQKAITKALAQNKDL